MWDAARTLVQMRKAGDYKAMRKDNVRRTLQTLTLRFTSRVTSVIGSGSFGRTRTSGGRARTRKRERAHALQRQMRLKDLHVRVRSEARGSQAQLGRRRRMYIYVASSWRPNEMTCLNFVVPDEPFDGISICREGAISF